MDERKKPIPGDHRPQQMERLLEISRELTSTISLETLLHRIVEAAVELTDSEAAAILLPTDDSHFAAATRLADKVAKIQVPIESSIAGKVLASGEPLLVSDPHADPRYFPAVEQLTGFQTRSLLAVPLQFKDQRIGVLEVENKHNNLEFCPTDTEILTVLAAQAAVAIENARLVESLQEARDLARALSNAGAALSDTLGSEAVLDHILEQMSRVVSYDAASIMLLEGDRARVWHGHGYEPFVDKDALQSISFTVAEVPSLHQMQQTGQPLAIPDVEQQDMWVRSRPEHSWIRSYVGVPIRVRSQVIGFLNVNSATPGAFSQRDAERLQAFADQAAIVIENARLYHQAQQELNERVRAEKELRKHRDHLEDLVKERTAKLEAVNAELEQEIAERKQAEESLQRYTERLKILHEIGQSILAARLPETISLAAIHRIRQLIPCQRAMVMAVEETGEIRMLAAESSRGTGPVAGMDVYENMYEEQPLGTGQARGVEDLAMLSQRLPSQEALYAASVRSYVVVPLTIQDELVGTLNLESDQPRAFTADHLTIATEVAASLAVTIRQVRLYEQAQQEIAERMRAETALRQYTGELEERNAELDAFAHTVAHDLKNSVSSIVSYADVLRESYATLPDKMREKFIHSVAQNARKMSIIIDELLLLSSVRGVEDIERHPLEMGRIVAEARGRLLHLLEEHNGEIVLPDRWPIALGYAPWIEEVWTNYISNAIKYGGRPPRVELGATKENGDTIRFWVRDNGPGLSAEAQARLFTPFEQLHQSKIKGHGLGLSIVQRIVHKLGGEVGVESEVEPGRGSTFYFILPAIAGQTDPD
jgi:GAF domain-containing protein